MKKRSIEPDFFLAKLAEQAERYSDMFNFISSLISKREPRHFTQEERNLFSHAFKNLITPKRQTWRHLVQQKKDSEALKLYTASVETRLHQLCMDIVSLVNDQVLP